MTTNHGIFCHFYSPQGVPLQQLEATALYLTTHYTSLPQWQKTTGFPVHTRRRGNVYNDPGI